MASKLSQIQIAVKNQLQDDFKISPLTETEKIIKDHEAIMANLKEIFDSMDNRYC